jgi:hypothetical protein
MKATPTIRRDALRVVADAIRDLYRREQDARERGSGMDSWSALRTLDWVVDGLCNSFESNNELFDRPTFLAAAGVPFDPDTWDIDRRAGQGRPAHEPALKGAGGKPAPGVVSAKMRRALRVAAAGSGGVLPADTPPTVAGALYDEGLADRPGKGQPRRINQAGRDRLTKNDDGRDGPPPREAPERVTSAMLYALVAAAAQPQGHIPRGTGPTVLGDLYAQGWAERATAEHPRRITADGWAWLAGNPGEVEVARRGQPDVIRRVLTVVAEHAGVPAADLIAVVQAREAAWRERREWWEARS